MKLNDYDFKNAPNEVNDFKNDVTVLLNYGKYQPQVLASAPTWKGAKGEFCFVLLANSLQLYVYAATAGTSWTKLSAVAI